MPQIVCVIQSAYQISFNIASEMHNFLFGSI